MPGAVSLQHRELCDRIAKRAGVDLDKTFVGGLYHDEFRSLMATLTHIGGTKVDQYGDFRLQDIRGWDRETWGAYWDIQRKFGRLENQLATFDSALKDHAKIDDMLETLGDQAVYCVRMIQILCRLEEKGLVPK